MPEVLQGHLDEQTEYSAFLVESIETREHTICELKVKLFTMNRGTSRVPLLS